jgi:hypothetical protein
MAANPPVSRCGEVDALIDCVAGNQPLAASVRQDIIERTGSAMPCTRAARFLSSHAGSHRAPAKYVTLSGLRSATEWCGCRKPVYCLLRFTGGLRRVSTRSI